VFVVDTNVLIYAADRDAPEHDRCRELLEDWRHQAGAWYLTWGVVYEFLRVTTHPSVFRTPWPAAEAWAFVEAVLASPSLRVLVATPQHREVLAGLLAEVPHATGNLFHDAHTAALMREHGVGVIYTRDTDFHRFPFLEVIDPLAG
jgi:toxin-antitoxin system PIN domain toxin